MTKTLLLITLFMCNLLAIGQENKLYKILTTQEADSIFTKEIKSDLNIKFPVFKVYEYNDKAGKNYLLLTENEYKKEGESKNNKIQAFNFTVNNGELKTNWKLSDFILEQGNVNSKEFSIWFWTKYISLEDLDNDGYADPIIIYGTSGFNGTSDGRIKILTYHNGSKRAIRHQNGVLDFERSTEVDSGFYELPLEIKEYVIKLMRKINENGQAIFPYGWEESMKNKELKFEEN